jgi:flagellar basal body-associated protein FliL
MLYARNIIITIAVVMTAFAIGGSLLMFLMGLSFGYSVSKAVDYFLPIKGENK